MSAGFDESSYPLPGFYFKVTMGDSSDLNDAAFQEVSGISVEMDTRSQGEGGQNNYAHNLPEPPKYEKLKLRRGVMLRNSAFRNWCQTCLINNYDFNQPLQLYDVAVTLLTPDGTPAVRWTFHDCYPVKWGVSDLNSQKNEILVESVDLVFTYFDEMFYNQ
jgi:phage tail-like protein